MNKFLILSVFFILSVIVLVRTQSCGVRSGSYTSASRKSGMKSQTINGMAKIQGESFEILTVNGAASLDDVSAQEVIINGSLGATNLVTQKLTANGSVNLTASKIEEIAKVAGALEAYECLFNAITLLSEYAVLNNSKVKTIDVKKVSDFRKKVQQIELVNTAVEGDIVFEGGDGEVILKNGAFVQGKVIGGRII